ncbi:hypothetical protein P692DRAFT_20877765 [Suillus brevipes Sb2]|nr:hypothetical protein P692DRAFT_20877765 [Suillus brevipes Sb2]
MPSRTFICKCAQCCNIGVDGVPRKPGGKALPITLKHVHLALDIATSSECESSILHLACQAFLQPSPEREAPHPQYSQREHLMHPTDMPMQVDDLAAELFAITLTDGNATSDSHDKLHIARALQAAGMQHQSRAEATLNVAESWIERARTQISCATSRDVLRSIRNELFAIIKTLGKVKHKVSSIVSRRAWLETTCDEIQTLLFSKEDELPVSSGPVEFDSSHHYDLPIDYADEIVQVSLFLGAVSVIIFGIGRRHGEFLMGVLSLILSLAMDAQSPHSESR